MALVLLLLSNMMLILYPILSFRGYVSLLIFHFHWVLFWLIALCCTANRSWYVCEISSKCKGKTNKGSVRLSFHYLCIWNMKILKVLWSHHLLKCWNATRSWCWNLLGFFWNQSNSIWASMPLKEFQCTTRGLPCELRKKAWGLGYSRVFEPQV